MSLTRKINQGLIAGQSMASIVAPDARRTKGDQHAAVAPSPEKPVFRVRCIGACGDVLIAAAVAGALKKEHPGCHIRFETMRGPILFRNPHIDEVLEVNLPPLAGEQLIDLRPEADWKPRKHRVQWMADNAGVALDGLHFFLHTEPHDFDLPAGYVVLHPGPTDDPMWKGRNWMPRRWNAVARRLADCGHTVAIVGKTTGGAQAWPSGVLDLRGQTTLYQLASLIRDAKMLVGIESLPAIIAQAFGVPAALFFGSISPELRIFRDNIVPIRATSLRCLGCHHRETVPVVTSICRVGDEPCQSRVHVEDVVECVRVALDKPRATHILLPGCDAPHSDAIKMAAHHLSDERTRPLVIIRRWSTAGDVLVSSSVAAAIKKQLPHSRIVFETEYPAILKGHPHVNDIVPRGWQGKPDVIVDMNEACERLPYTNMLAAYASRASVSPADCEFWLHTEHVHGLPGQYVAIHPGPAGAASRAWVGRDWYDDRFAAVARYLADRGLTPVLVGSHAARPADFGECVDLRGKTTIYQLAHVIANAKFFIGIDSFPFHVAQAFNVPGLAFFGSIRPELRIYRENMAGVSATELPCIGCHHDRRTAPGEPPETSVCRIGHDHCRTAVTAKRFIEVLDDQLSANAKRAKVYRPTTSKPFAFLHGLGDVAHFALSIPLYANRGHRVRVFCKPEYRSLMRAAGAEIVTERPTLNHEWIHGEIPANVNLWRDGNKAWKNISASPMPDIGRSDLLWREYCDSRVDLRPFASDEERATTAKLLDDMPRPLVVLHTRGEQNYARRSLPPQTTAEIASRLLERTGTILSLDSECVPEPYRSILGELGRLPTVMEMFLLLDSADLFVGIDSGPAHFMRFTGTPAIVCWTKPDPMFGCPSLLSLPRKLTTNIVTNSGCRFNSPVPPEYNPRVSPGTDEIDPAFVASVALEILEHGRNTQGSGASRD